MYPLLLYHLLIAFLDTKITLISQYSTHVIDIHFFLNNWFPYFRNFSEFLYVLHCLTCSFFAICSDQNSPNVCLFFNPGRVASPPNPHQGSAPGGAVLHTGASAKGTPLILPDYRIFCPKKQKCHHSPILPITFKCTFYVGTSKPGGVANLPNLSRF